MRARFILSLDCEGKWGVADHLTPTHEWTLTDARLRDAYSGIVDLLDEYAIPSSFAFVGAFSQSRRAFQRLRPQFDELASAAPHYLRPALIDIDAAAEGWHGDWAVDLVGSARTSHEIAFHGLSHVPWTQADQEFIERERSLFRQLEGPVRDSRTFVYPRNLVAHVDKLSGFGMVGYRTAPPKRSRLGSLASELNIWSRAQQDPPNSQMAAIPSGYFVNWQSGPRRLVPKAVSAYRAEALLADAQCRGAIVHYWLHPENVASAPDTLGLLRRILAIVARMRDSDECRVITQLEYSLERKAG